METRSNHVLVGAVVLILLAVLAIFTVWIARVGGTKEHEYDIFFKQAVDGLAKGSSVTYSGVPSGQVKSISLWKNDPQFVRVRISVNEENRFYLSRKSAGQVNSNRGFTNAALAICYRNNRHAPNIHNSRFTVKLFLHLDVIPSHTSSSRENHL